MTKSIHRPGLTKYHYHSEVYFWHLTVYSSVNDMGPHNKSKILRPLQCYCQEPYLCRQLKV